MPAIRNSKKPNQVKTSTERISLKALISTAKASKDEHGFSKSTIGSYERALRQARKWLQEQVEAETSFERPPGCPDIVEPSESWTLEELRFAFDKKPNGASPAALALFIATRCFTKGSNGKELKKGIAEQTHSAWKKFWDDSDPNGLYRGAWLWDPEKKIARENPASAPEVREIVKAVIARDAALGERQHSAAMSKEYMDRIMAWSDQECPKKMLASLTPCLSDFAKIRLKVTKHLFMRAFASSGWTLWTRQAKLYSSMHTIALNLRTQDEYQWKYDECHLEQRKGWQHHISKEGDLESHKYEIHPQQDMPSVDMHFHMNTWITFLEAFVYGHELYSNDFIFPSITSTGTVQPGTPISHDTIQKWLDEFVEGAKIELGTTKLTTHCFRRGGAQYRFMYAPVGKRWSLATIRWWGGWAQGEHRDTLIRYLLDELYHYEEGHGDALRPIKVEKDTSFLNECSSTQVPTLTGWTQIIKTSFEELRRDLQQDFQMTSNHCNCVASNSWHHSEQRPNLMHPRAQLQFTSIPHQDTIEVSSTRAPSDPQITLRIPKIIKPKKGHADVPPAWKQAVDHWVRGDPSQNLPALKDWKPEWTKGKYKKMYAEAYHQRKVVALEFLERFNCDEAAFLNAWPQASRGFSILFNAIMDDRKARGLSKARNSRYGSPVSRMKERKD
ncbi:hypothetical protein BU17DRAFT_47457 [Hysterangium stoloniferum]|nr:hypothetical protein BU17DRAFT_47457 [Hysterangium stoloniferum]